MKENIVGFILEKNYEYPASPFNPSNVYPEFQGMSFIDGCDPNNKIYQQVRDLLVKLGLDRDNHGNGRWNPFKSLVNKKDNIIIKPNLVLDSHPLGQIGIIATITHASIVRPIIDYLLLATEGDCNITICDVPLQSADWSKVVAESGLSDLKKYYAGKNINIELLDLRYEISVPNKEGFYYKRIKKVRDPKGYVVVDLKEKSYFQDIISDYKRLEITDYELGTVGKHHNPAKNEYLIPQTVLNADLFINIPKLKTHRKAGVTLALKNLIGINADKSWIAHHRRGRDEYPAFNFKEFFRWKLNHYLKQYFPAPVNTFVRKAYRVICLKGQSIKAHGMISGGPLMEGNWHGNDTIWRTIIDLNNIIYFSSNCGQLSAHKARNYLTIIDGIVGMEGEGPMDGYPKKCGILIGGFHPVAVDYITAFLMGFEWSKIPSVREGFSEKYYGLTKFPTKDIAVFSNVNNWNDLNLRFKPTKGWEKHIERKD